jgi:hypothetical protein
MQEPTAAETLAEMILRAAGSGLRHYTPANKAAIIKAAEVAINAIITSQPNKA